MSAYANVHWSSADGLKLHARDHPGGADGRPPIVCLPGLTRNARDFEGLAARLSPDWRVLTVDFRGRGESAYDRDPSRYVPATYAADVAALCDVLALRRFVAIGTSLGGLVAIVMAAAAGGVRGGDGAQIVGAVLNDIGPAIEPAGLARIRGHVGRAGSFPTWVHAARALAESNRDIYPDWALADWLVLAKRLYKLSGAGRIVLDYDMKIAEPLRAAASETPPDLWPAFAWLAACPVAILRGERSDILSAQTAARMVASSPNARLTVVPGVGHAPTLDEPVAIAAVDRLLTRVLAEPGAG